MNTTLEHLAACKKLLRVEVEAAEVDSAFDATTREFVRLARVPGFRPGKAPRHLVAKAFEQQIGEEVRRKLLNENLRQALQEQKLKVVGNPDIEEIQFGKGQTFQFAATLETAPEFELPEYRGLQLKKEVRAVTEEDVQRALHLLQEERATYLDVERPVQVGDFVVVNYVGTCEGKPLTELAPTARGLTEKQGFWLEIGPETFIAGFAEQLVGANAGEKKTVEVDFPADFVTPQLAGRHGVYDVELVQVKEKVVPELNDEFARAYGAENTDALVAGVRRDLENELAYKLKRGIRDQLVQGLLARVNFELPESVVQRETRNVVYDIVRENTERGISRQAIDQQKDQIFSVASNSARERIKASFVLEGIAEKEGIKADVKEIQQRILVMAEQNQIKPEKLIQQLKDRNGIQEIEHQIVVGKVLDFLEQQAVIEEVLPPGGTPAQ